MMEYRVSKPSLLSLAHNDKRIRNYGSGRAIKLLGRSLEWLLDQPCAI